MLAHTLAAVTELLTQQCERYRAKWLGKWNRAAQNDDTFTSNLSHHNKLLHVCRYSI